MVTSGAIHIEGDTLTVPAAALDHAGFRRWVTSDDFPERVRATYIAGDVFIEMSPEAIDTHNQVKLELTIVVGAIVTREGLGQFYVDGALFTNEEASVSTEPDAMVALFATLESGRLHDIPKVNREDDAIELVGTPDIVIEVVSDSSRRKDLVLLRHAYFEAGIPEYWIIDARGADLAFEILSRADHAYESRSPRGGAQSSLVLGRSFRLERDRNRVGRWQYRLNVSDSG
jgi:Uma2 family endonuclease